MEQQFLNRFKQTILDAEEKLLLLTETQAETPRTPGKWSPKEIIGHLIDSASNNHQRFVRAQFKNDLIFEGYQQDDWVKVQQYQREDWKQLVALWKNFNLHILHAVSQIPDSVLKKERANHNFDERAFKPVPKDQPVTLEYFIVDYLDHLKHHLRQIFR
ncbi:MAG: DinB family protein [Ignavibacteriales bacterium]|nr:DinB family protein [Ignavibacteriales bacterium]